MFIEIQRVKGIPYLRLVQSRKKRNEDGEWKIAKELICTIGPLSKYDDGQPDYLKRLRESFRSGHPLIPELEQFVTRRYVRLTFHNGSPECILRRVTFSDSLLDVIFRDIGMTKVLQNIQLSSQSKYDLLGLVKLMVFGRLLDPKSKLATTGQNEMYFHPPVKDTNFNVKAIYRALDDIYANRERIMRAIYRATKQHIERDTSVVFYDVTNTWLEIDEPDEDAEEGGERPKSTLRKRGKSKEGRHDPIVQTALFLDRSGIPLAIKEFPGNVPDVSTMPDALSQLLRITDLEKFLFVADRGICSAANREELILAGLGYIISKSILKSSRKDQDWITDPKGWTVVSSDFKYKSCIRKDLFNLDGTGNSEVPYKTVVYWSRHYYERDAAKHRKLLDFLESLQNDDGYVPLPKVESAFGKKRFKKELIVKSVKGKPSGEVIRKKDLLASIDLDKLKHETELLGYYQIVTSEVEMPDLEVISTYKSLVEIEGQFLDLKSNLDLRPIYVRTDEHLVAHLVICFIALVMLRLIQRRIVQSDPELSATDALWTWGLSGKRIQEALNNWQLAKLPDDYYAFTLAEGHAADSGVNADLSKILSAYGISLEPDIYTKGTLRDLKNKMHAF